MIVRLVKVKVRVSEDTVTNNFRQSRTLITIVKLSVTIIVPGIAMLKTNYQLTEHKIICLKTYLKINKTRIKIVNLQANTHYTKTITEI